MLPNLAEPAPGFPSAVFALGIEFAIAVAMILAAIASKRTRKLLWSEVTGFWFAGLLLVTSTFFCDFIGPWGVGMSPYATLTWNCKIGPGLLTLFPRIATNYFGACTWLAAFSSIFFAEKNSTRIQWRLMLAGSILYSTLLMSVAAWYSLIPHPQVTVSTQSLAIVGLVVLIAIFAIALVLRLIKSHSMRNAWFHILPTTLLLIGLSGGILNIVRNGEPLWVLRPGFWLNLGGLSVLFFVSLRDMLRRPPSAANACATCGYNLFANTSGICPECGTSCSPIQPQESITTNAA